MAAGSAQSCQKIIQSMFRLSSRNVARRPRAERREDECEGAGPANLLLTHAPAEAPLPQHRNPGWKGSRGGGGWETRGPAGLEEKNRLDVLTAAPFFLTHFAHGSDFLLKGWAFQGPLALLSRGCLLLRSRASFPVYKSACF